MASSILTVPTDENLSRLAKRFKEVDPSAIRTVHLFVHAATELSNDIEKFFARHGLSTGRFSAMMILFRDTGRGLRQNEVADVLGVKPATMTGLIDGLEKQGFVRRENDPSDRRGTIVRLTPAGVKILEKIAPDYFTRMSQLMKSFSPSERSAFSKYLDKARGNIGAMTL
ncbi:MAG: MarR family transcriptional regulator [Oligoflexia bacterium]|nr:MarR family transcriptional regulator [Oligoflexia bacterium]